MAKRTPATSAAERAAIKTAREHLRLANRNLTDGKYRAAELRATSAIIEMREALRLAGERGE